MPHSSHRYSDFNYDRQQLEATWVHLGWGNFARAFIGYFADTIAQKGEKNFGLIAVAPSARQEHDVQTLNNQQNIYHLVRRNGREICQRIGAVMDVVIGASHASRLIAQMAEEKTSLVTMTVTKDGYYLKDNGDLQKELLADDIQALKTNQYDKLRTVPGWILAGLQTRYRNNLPPFIVMSCDNIIYNGNMTTKLILSLAREIGDERFSEYLEEKLVCPNTAVDRITPKQNYNLLGSYIESKYGAQDNCAVVCEEHFELIVQDNGRIPPKIVEAFSKAGATFVDDVTPYQDRKIRILNGGHMLFGLAGTIMQIQSVREAMHNPAARTLLDVFFEQVSSALAPIQPVNIAPFIQTTIGRFNNPHLTDQTSRLVAATTSKVPARLLNIEALKNGFPSDASAFAIAIWLRYLEQRDDSGNPYSLHEHDTHTIQRHGLDISNPALGKNLFTFLYQTDSGISPVVMSQFCEEIVTYAHTIKNLGLERSIKITFPQQVVQKPHKLPLYAAGY